MPTRRSHGEGNIRKRADGRWESPFSLQDGTRKSFYGATRKEVQDKLKRAQRDTERSLDLSQDRITVGHYLQGWFANVKNSLRHSSWKSYESYLRLHIVPQLRYLRLRDLNAGHVNQMMRHMEEDGLSPRSRNYARSILRKALNDAIDSDLIVSNAAAKARSATQQPQRIDPLTPEEVFTLLRHTRNHWLGPLIHVAVGTGLRQGELLGLRWEDVDFESPSLTVRT